MEFGGLELDYITLSASYEGDTIPLTRSEWFILECLRRHFGEVVTRQELLYAISGTTVPIKTRTIDVHISSLRRKIYGLGPFALLGVYGKGYRLSKRTKEKNS